MLVLSELEHECTVPNSSQAVDSYTIQFPEPFGYFYVHVMATIEVAPVKLKCLLAVLQGAVVQSGTLTFELQCLSLLGLPVKPLVIPVS